MFCLSTELYGFAVYKTLQILSFYYAFTVLKSHDVYLYNQMTQIKGACKWERYLNKELHLSQTKKK